MYKKALSKNNIENIGRNLNSVKKLLSEPNLNKDKRKIDKELEVEKVNREAWRKSFVPSYFASEWGLSFLNKLANKENSFFKTLSENDFIQESKDSNQESPAESKNNKEEINNQTKNYYPAMSYLETEFSSEKKTNTNNGSGRFQRYQPQFKFTDKLDPTKLPNSIKTTRPNAVPNSLFICNEEPVRRKVNNSIIKASHLNGRSLDKRRGLDVYPKEIKFGILREGFTYVCDFELINVGIDACRFKIKQPPPESGIKVMFKPGPIAAGMNRDINIVLLAIFTLPDENVSEQVYPKIRSLVHELEITTETDILKLSIQAEIASIEEFRRMFRGNLDAGKEKNVRILSVRPGNTKEVLTKPLSVKNKNIDEEMKMSQIG